MEASFYTVLIVEDDVGLSFLVRKQLERKGLKTVTVNSGSEALQYLKGNRDVIMLLDYNLGDMTGADLVSSLKKRGLEVPFIVITGQGSETVAVETMKLGARDYIIKNNSFLELLPQVVMQVIDEQVLTGRLATTEDALRREKTHLLNNIPDMVFQIDSQGRFISCNPATCKILGYTDEELMAKKILDIVHPDDVKAVTRDHSAVKQGQKILKHPIRFVHRNGQVKWVEGNIVAVYNEHGQAEAISGIYQDITQSKLQNEELKKAQERAKLIADTSPSLVFEIAPDNCVKSMNKAAREFFSAKTEIDNGKPLLYPSFFEGKWSAQIACALKESRNGRTLKTTAMLEKNPGGKKWFDIVLSPLWEGGRQPGGVVIATAWDVSERVGREQQIKDSLEREARSVEQAKILQSITFAGGYDMKNDSAKVASQTAQQVCQYLECSTALSYIFDENGECLKVYENNAQDKQQADKLVEIICSPRGKNIIKKIKTAKRLSNTALYELAEDQAQVKAFMNSTIFVPYMNAGVNLGFGVFMNNSLKLQGDLVKFLSAVSKCAGLGIANAVALNAPSSQIRNRMHQLEGTSVTDYAHPPAKMETQSLTAIVEAGVNYLNAKAGLVLLLNKNQQTLNGIAGYNLTEKETASVKISNHACICWDCVDDNEMIYCRDISEEEKFIDESLTNLTEKSLLIIPIFNREEVIGLYVLIDPAAPPRQSAVSVIESFAWLGGESINASMLADRASRLDRELSNIRKQSLKLTAGGDINIVLKNICEAALRTLNAQTAWIGTLSKDRNEIKYATHSGQAGNAVTKVRYKYDPSAKGDTLVKCIADKEPVVVNEMLSDARLHLLARGKGYNSCCSVPIMSKEEVFGALTVYHHEQEAFSSQNISILEEFCDIAALTISNHRLKQTLMESESLKNIILESVNEALMVVDNAGAVVSVNEAAQKLFNRDLSEMKGRYCGQFCRKATPLWDVLDGWIENGSAGARIEGWVEFDRGPKMYLSIKSKKTTIEQVPCLLMTIVDLTMQKKMNASLEHAEKLTSVGRIAGQIAHEIGNPLTIISSQVQRMVADGKADIEKLSKMLSHIDRISSLIRRFSDIERKDPLTITSADVQEVVDNILSLVMHSKPFKGIEIQKSIAPDLHPVEMDKNKITQVLLNLLINAADACEGKGRIDINAQMQKVPVEINNDVVNREFLVLSVADNGRGIDKEVIDHIFEPFYTNKESGKGTGLGLSVSLSIVDQHQGWINVETQPHRGANFIIYLPVRNNPVGTEKRQIKQIEAGKDVKKYNESDIMRS